MKKILLLTSLLLTLVTSQMAAQNDSYSSFGEKITAESAVSLAELEKGLTNSDSVATKVTGQIKDICQVKGCWMNVSDEDAAGNGLFVRFKDYGFFVPKDAGGKEVIMEGVAYRELTSVEELQHYAKDAGQSEEEISKITEPREEIRFLAKGVLIKN